MLPGQYEIEFQFQLSAFPAGAAVTFITGEGDALLRPWRLAAASYPQEFSAAVMVAVTGPDWEPTQFPTFALRQRYKQGRPASAEGTRALYHTGVGYKESWPDYFK